MAVVASHRSFPGAGHVLEKEGPAVQTALASDMTAMDGPLAATDRWSFVMGWCVDVR